MTTALQALQTLCVPMLQRERRVLATVCTVGYFLGFLDLFLARMDAPGPECEPLQVLKV
jgi:hypothetical protein